MGDIDKQALQTQIIKLLDKAGRDMRLTPKVLRTKAEERLKLPAGGLHTKRELIKKYIIKWWYSQLEYQTEMAENAKAKEKEREKEKEKEKDKTKSSDSSALEHTLSRLTKFAKAAGKGSSFFAAFKEMGTKEKVKNMRSKLRSNGFTFSDTPTHEEIQAIQKESELKKERDALDQNTVLSTKRKSTTHADDTKDNAEGGKIESNSNKKAAVGNGDSHRPTSKRAIQYNSSDEEGDF